MPHDSLAERAADLKGVTRLRAAVSFCIAAGADGSLIPLVLTPPSCGGVKAWPSVCLPVN